MVPIAAVSCAIFILMVWPPACVRGSARQELSPRHEILKGVDVVWQIPETPRSVLLLLHGLDSNALIFWDRDANCPKCTGLPEDRAITLAALNRGYATIAISSVANWLAWPVEGNVDVANVVAILQDWRLHNGLLQLPLTALGTSHGGRFLSGLAAVVDFFAIVLMICAGDDDAMRAAHDRGTFPPTLFADMPKDEMTDIGVEASMARLAEMNVPVARVMCNPIPVRETYFTHRIPDLSLELSAAIVQALDKHGYLDSHGYLTYNFTVPEGWQGWYDPMDWNVVLDDLHIFPLPDYRSKYWRDGVHQELRLADGFHSTTSLPSSEMLDWLDGDALFLYPGSLLEVASENV